MQTYTGGVNTFKFRATTHNRLMEVFRDIVYKYSTVVLVYTLDLTATGYNTKTNIIYNYNVNTTV